MDRAGWENGAGSWAGPTWSNRLRADGSGPRAGDVSSGRWWAPRPTQPTKRLAFCFLPRATGGDASPLPASSACAWPWLAVGGASLLTRPCGCGSSMWENENAKPGGEPSPPRSGWAGPDSHVSARGALTPPALPAPVVRWASWATAPGAADCQPTVTDPP